MKKYNGFTLIELMIVVVIIGIIGAISAPSYLKYSKKTATKDATVELLEVAFREEEFYNGAYTLSLTDLNHSGVSEDAVYNIKITSTDLASGYLITASVASGKENKVSTDCKVLTLNSVGVKTPNGVPAGSADCWP